MSKNTRIAVIALIVLVLVAALLLLLWKSTRLEPSQGAKTVSITITHLDGTEKKLVLHTDQEYLLGAMLEEDENLVGGFESAYGYTLDTVDGEFTTVEDVANALYYVSQDKGALTGQSLRLTHGWAMM